MWVTLRWNENQAGVTKGINSRCLKYPAHKFEADIRLKPPPYTRCALRFTW